VTSTEQFEGTLQDEALPLVLYRLYSARATGCLRLETRVGRHEVYLRDGCPVSVSLPGSGELLGKVLVEMGILDEQTHKRTLAEPPPKGMKYGEWLVERQLVTADHMRLALKAQVRRKLHRLFFLNEGKFGFTPGQHQQGLEGHESLKIHPSRAIYQGVRSAWDAERLAGALFLLDGKALKIAVDDGSVARYGLGPEDGKIADLLRKGYWLLTDLVNASGLPVQPVHALVYAFYVTEALDIKEPGEVQLLKRAEPSQAAPLPSKPVTAAPPRPAPPVDVREVRKQLELKAQSVERENLFQVLELNENATREQIKNAYFDAAKKYHPDRLSSVGLEALRADVEKIFRRVSEAYSTLFDDARREDYKKSLARPAEAPSTEAHQSAMRILEAELAFRRGEALMRKNEVLAAIREFDQAVAGNPEDGEHLAWLTFAKVAAGQLSYADAKARFQEATKLSPKCGRAFYFLGLSLKEEKDFERALSMFKKAVELDARLIDAEREMRLIHMRKEKSGGWFGRKK
jgi:curved DNA-binding protein CbpA